MTTALTARSVLLRDERSGHDLDVRLEPSVSGLDLGGLGQAAGAAVRRDLARAAAGLLDLDLMDVLAAGWRAHSELCAAAQRTVDNPGSAETVRLVTHRVSHRSRPYVDLLVGDTPLARVTLTLTVDMDITGLEASVWQGCLVAVHAGQCELTVSLALDDSPPMSRTIELLLPTTVTLDEALRLV